MTEKKISRRTPLFYIISTLVIAGILIAAIFWQKIKYHLVRQQLNSAITGKSEGLYQISYRNLVMDEVAGNVSVEDVHLSTDSAIYKELSKQENSAPARIDIRIPKLIITGVKTPKALLNKEIEAHSVNIQSAVIELSLQKQDDKPSKSNLAAEIYRQVLSKLQSIKADSLILQEITFIIKDPESGQTKFKGSGFSCRLSDILIDSVHQNDSSRVLFAREIAVGCSDLSLNSKDKKYKYIFSGLEYRSDRNRLKAAKILIEPQLSEAAFANAYKYSKDRYQFTIENLDIRNINRYALFSQRLIADSMILGNSSFKIFRDVSNPHDSIDRTQKYPQQSLMKLPLPVNINTVVFVRSFIEYKEKNAKSDSSGKVQFYAVHAVLSNLTNIPEFIGKNNKMKLNFQSRFLNRAPMHAELIMILKDPAGRFTLDAKMGGMNAAYLNPMIQPMALAKIDKGKIQSLSYHLNADDLHGVGNLTFLYSDLKLVLLRKDEDQNKYKAKILPTLAAGLLVKNSNPAKGETRTSRVDYKRDKYRSMFNLMWKSMFTALKETAGMK
ncbi:MAG: hypothetical protein Q8926_05420 [Bacteroidota bacterium]|nr:hypothetical protein [Bacteroidota bacterium]